MLTTSSKQLMTSSYHGVIASLSCLHPQLHCDVILSSSAKLHWLGHFDITQGFVEPELKKKKKKRGGEHWRFCLNMEKNFQWLSIGPCKKVFIASLATNVKQDTFILTRWVPYDGYIRHQNDHLSGRMTDISVMGEWQVAGVGGTWPLRNVLGEAREGRFSFEAQNYLFSFQSYVRFEEFFFCFPRFWKIWRQTFKLWSFWFRQCLGGLFENSAPSLGLFFELQLRPRVFFENFLYPSQMASRSVC